MPRTDDPINVITGVRSIGEEQRREAPVRRNTKQRQIKPGKDSVTISSRARRLADIEDFLGDGADKEAPEDNKADQ